MPAANYSDLPRVIRRAPQGSHPSQPGYNCNKYSPVPIPSDRHQTSRALATYLYARARTHARTALPRSLGGLRLKSVTQLRLGIMRPPYTITVTVRHAYDVTLPIPP